MPAPAPDKVMRLAARHHVSGRLRDAAALYRRILQQDPRSAEALHALGVMAHQTGRADAAEKLLARAVDADPDRAAARDDLGAVYFLQGRIDEALAAFAAAVRTDPSLAAAHAHLGAALARLGRYEEAVAAYQRAVDVGLLGRRRRAVGVDLKPFAEPPVEPVVAPVAVDDPAADVPAAVEPAPVDAGPAPVPPSGAVEAAVAATPEPIDAGPPSVEAPAAAVPPWLGGDGVVTHVAVEGAAGMVFATAAGPALPDDAHEPRHESPSFESPLDDVPPTVPPEPAQPATVSVAWPDFADEAAVSEAGARMRGSLDAGVFWTATVVPAPAHGDFDGDAATGPADVEPAAAIAFAGREPAPATSADPPGPAVVPPVPAGGRPEPAGIGSEVDGATATVTVAGLPFVGEIVDESPAEVEVVEVAFVEVGDAPGAAGVVPAYAPPTPQLAPPLMPPLVPTVVPVRPRGAVRPAVPPPAVVPESPPLRWAVAATARGGAGTIHEWDLAADAAWGGPVDPSVAVAVADPVSSGLLDEDVDGPMRAAAGAALAGVAPERVDSLTLVDDDGAEFVVVSPDDEQAWTDDEVSPPADGGLSPADDGMNGQVAGAAGPVPEAWTASMVPTADAPGGESTIPPETSLTDAEAFAVAPAHADFAEPTAEGSAASTAVAAAVPSAPAEPLPAVDEPQAAPGEFEDDAPDDADRVGEPAGGAGNSPVAGDDADDSEGADNGRSLAEVDGDAHTNAVAATAVAVDAAADPLVATRALAKQIRRRRRAPSADARRAVELHKEGTALLRQRRVDEAIDALSRLVELHPASAKAQKDLGAAYLRANRLDEAAACLSRALELRPRFADALASLGDACHLQGKVDDAAGYYRRAIALRPSADKAHSNLLLTLNYSRKLSPQALFDEHLAWAKQHGRPLAAEWRPHANDPSPERPVRVGYVSPDLRRHSVNFFLEPLLARRDRQSFHVTCYSDVIRPDDVTDRIRAGVDDWRDVRGLSDVEVAEAVREDAVDILVDLAGHTGTNRLGVFARRPAPVQVTYLGYPNTTGLEAIDYRVTDEAADPTGQTERLHTEHLIRLPSFLCYAPPPEAPPVSPPPSAAAGGRVTFGCFNVLAKVTPEAIGLWARVMAALPGSRMVMKDRLGSLAYPARRRFVQDIFAYHRINPDRLDLLGREQGFADHLAAYAKVDVVLDPFPYNGTTTTCEALWMGVPVITLAGNRHASRVGVSILTAAGLTEFITPDAEAYARAAVTLARDGARLALLRRTLRQRLSASTLMDQKRFVAGFERTYREMWRWWCRNHGGK